MVFKDIINKLNYKFFLLRFKILWKIKDLAPSRRYYVRIRKKESTSFINITIYPPDGAGKVYDPSRILEEFIRQVKQNASEITNIYGFTFDNQTSTLTLRTNCTLVHNDV